MNRKELQELSRIRIKEAKALLDKKLYDGAYYLAGYAVECALKACIAKNVREHDFPDKRLVIDSYTHDLAKLVKAASISDELKRKIAGSSEFAANWDIAKDWSEDSRYKRNKKAEALDLYNAIADPQNGILSWIKSYW